eukprot:419452_1
MANIVDWSLDSSSLRRNLLNLSKPKLIKACKYKKVSTNGTKQDMTQRILNKHQYNKNRKSINIPLLKPKQHQQKQNKQILNANSNNINENYKQTEEIIVSGFIRRIESLFKHNKSMPDDCIGLIIIFYKNTIILFCHSYTGTTDKFNICFMNNTNNKLCLNINEKLRLLSPHCYIPNASHILKNSLLKNYINFQHEKYDAILSYATDNNTNHGSMGMFARLFAVKNLILILFSLNDQNDELDYFILKSNISTKNYCNSLLFCGEKHGIIGTTYSETLFRLPLQNTTDLNTMIFNEIDSKFCRRGFFPKTVYIDKDEKLFSMQCKSVWKRKLNVPQIRHCSLFDLNTYKSKSIKSYEFKHTNVRSDAMCYHENNIYFVSDMDIVSKYDCMKNKWINLYDNEYIVESSGLQLNPQLAKSPVIWVNCSNVLNGIFTETGQIKLRCFDARDKRKSWIDCYSPFLNEQVDTHINSYLFLSP